MENGAPGEHQDEKPENHRDEAHVQPHVPIVDVAEFMCHDPLQLGTGKELEAPPGDSDHGIGGLRSRREGVDPRFLVHHINLRHRGPGRDGHFLHHVEQLPFLQIPRMGEDEASPQILGNHPPALPQLARLVDASPEDQEAGRGGDEDEPPGIPEIQSVAGQSHSEGHPQIDCEDDGDQRTYQIKHQPLRPATSPVLCLEKVHEDRIG